MRPILALLYPPVRLVPSLLLLLLLLPSLLPSLLLPLID